MRDAITKCLAKGKQKSVVSCTVKTHLLGLLWCQKVWWCPYCNSQRRQRTSPSLGVLLLSGMEKRSKFCRLLFPTWGVYHCLLLKHCVWLTELTICNCKSLSPGQWFIHISNQFNSHVSQVQWSTSEPSPEKPHEFQQWSCQFEVSSFLFICLLFEAGLRFDSTFKLQ